MKKLKAIVEVWWLAALFLVAGMWQVIFNDRRADYNIVTKPLYTRKEKQIEKLERMYRRRHD